MLQGFKARLVALLRHLLRDSTATIWPRLHGCPQTLTLMGTAAILLAFANARVAQWIERLPPEQEAAGSNPAAGIQEEGRFQGGLFHLTETLSGV